MRSIFVAFVALVTAAVMSFGLAAHALSRSTAPAVSTTWQSRVDTTAHSPVYGAWICWYMPRLPMLCR